MAVLVHIPTALRALTGDRDAVLAEGRTVRALLDDLDARHTGLAARLVDARGVRRFVNLYLNDEDVRALDGLDTAVKDGDVVTIVSAIAGG